ncbi:Crp/Fnr family transcriptional regulator [Pedobacter rhizosphaerae]|uniref:cAMP-binding domain of CRP or a regulatory subunit of cAMP-dependent protein kinases n=1 Tax=Pedobacter rhizosphaerae TaxID=390241 RepID=A0A1H9N325_9SPHI|nr:Crp/Fnr family transcriptional regulator [Pedobacter rhizosphaerae]SER30322.1 cAMP-binding domain of CRP or a regulatory subunit of cAMP-dependent protein kinases [Pedobacter rhizosphaerae]
MNIKNYITRFGSLHQLPIGLESYLQIALKAIRFKKRQKISLAIPPELFLGFLERGTLRLYQIDPETHQEHTLEFLRSGHFLPPSLEFGIPDGKSLYLQALEDCELLAISEQHFRYLAKIFEECTLIYQLLSNQHLMRQFQHNQQLKTLSAKERLALFNKEYPGFFAFVSTTHISSFLGIHRNTLNFLRNGKAPKA